VPTFEQAHVVAVKVGAPTLLRGSQYVAVFTTVVYGSWTNSLAEGPNGCGLVVLDVEEAVQLGDLEQVADPLAEVHQL